jgi:hypothetical protein
MLRALRHDTLCTECALLLIGTRLLESNWTLVWAEATLVAVASSVGASRKCLFTTSDTFHRICTR